MRIVVSDYSGHPFQVQLSRALAALGHQVLHLYSASFQTPKGDLLRRDDDPPGFEIKGMRSAEAFRKDSFVKRRRQEIEMGGLIGGEIARFGPDVVFSSNAPIDTQVHIRRAARAAGAKFVFWVQDLYGEAIWRILRAKFWIFGDAVGRLYSAIERRLIRSSHHVVAISAEFKALIARRAGIAAEKVTVIENWAPLAEVPVAARDNAWAVANLPPSPVRFVYSGTLGFKHDPGLLLKIAQNVGGHVIVFSEGKAAEALARDAAAAGVGNLIVRDWLPFGDLPQALAGGDVLIVILEPDAGIFSVPSKVLTYLCAGRPILGSVPKSNLAARIILGAKAGLVEEPGDYAALIAAARRLEADAAIRAEMGANARAYAEKVFDIDTIAGKFATIAARLARPTSGDNQ
ncbi:MAG TPA: glycosyltransferase family 4 protein [Allosphingosinicella sp.]|nr:glycosyltransferase family 4 protein [Allosphingosinicella sp.]